MKLHALTLACLAAFTGVANATEPDACLVNRDLIYSESPLPHVAAALQQKNLTISVVGSASSTLPGSSGAKMAYPAQLNSALARQLPDVPVKVISHARSKWSAAEMVGEFANILSQDKPSLIIWQTGTVDAMRGIDPAEFQNTLDSGVSMLHEKGVDVILMNMQFSPRTETMIAASAYADDLRWVAMQQDIPLFDRFAVMKQWSELGTFDLYSADKSSATAERVHDCLGRLLAEMIIDTAKRDQATPNDRPQPKDKS
ncbi:MAG TPA: GDSL-type esterase/lipase family protein [Xanthobacteraceae bacterium]|jgi:hypothetical protein|nr:GDSL-type esterase/lipase family protein [Xanthobacteraceae bacterium]